MAARPTFPAATPSDYAVFLSKSTSMFKSKSVSLSVVKEKYVYDRQFLMDIRNRGFCYDSGHWLNVLSELGLLRRKGPGKPEASPTVAPARHHHKQCDRTRKRGMRGEAQARLTANPYKPALPTIMLANVRSLDGKIDYIRLWRASHRSVRDCCVAVFTETWLNQNITDAALQLDGLTLYRADRAASSGKLSGGGLAVYINNSWCQGGLYTLLTTH